MRKLMAFLLLLGTTASVRSGSDVPFAGKSGEGLASYLRLHYRPRTLAGMHDMTLMLYDPFRGCLIEISSGNMPEGYTAGGIVPASWWDEPHPYGDTLVRDIINFLPLAPEVVTYRSDYAPGIVEESRYTNGLWSAGLRRAGDIATDSYMFHGQPSGMLARTVFYMAVCYPASSWSPRGYMMMDPSPYPGLNSYATRLLLKWHEEYPPDEYELQRNNLASSIQSNSNPFVDYPDLASYLWGDRAGEPYAYPGTVAPLHGHYSISGPDVRLSSPHIPDDAVWTIDGMPATKSQYAPFEIGPGDHHLAYTSASGGVSGRVMIRIR